MTTSSTLRSVPRRSLPPASPPLLPPSSAAGRRPVPRRSPAPAGDGPRNYKPHPDGPIVVLDEAQLDYLNRRCTVTTWVTGAPFDRYKELDSPAMRRVLAERGCPHRSPLLAAAWLCLRRCPICDRLIVPDANRRAVNHGLADFIRWQFCSDACSRLRHELDQPTQADIAVECARFQASWTEAEWMRALDADPLRELIARVSDVVPLDPASLAL